MASKMLLGAAVATLIAGAEAHGRLTVPHARSGGDNGAVAGGPGDVHAFGTDENGRDKHTKYRHGICGNAAGRPQTYNKVGDVEATYTMGDTVEFKVVITAHHVGYFEFELCDSAGELSEECFMQHRLLKEGCDCTCGDDTTLSCEACKSCRWWWKPLTAGELAQSVTNGYPGPTLPGPGNLVAYEYTMRYKLPAGVKTSRGVVRWHYMTTNSCTSRASSPEEFWNCADIRIEDASGNAGPELSFDNGQLESTQPEDLISKLESQALKGVSATCPESESGALLGVGTEADYRDACGALVDEEYARCKSLSGGASSGQHADCLDPPESGILCESECSGGWFQCHNGVAYTKMVPAGTKCKGNEFVLEAECAGYVPPDDSYAPSPPEDAEPGTTSPPTAAPTSPPTSAPTSPPTSAPTSPPTSAPTAPPTQEDPNLPPPLLDEPTTAPPAPTAAPTSAPTAAPTAPPGADCGSCTACLWSNGVCYTDVTSSYCTTWSDNRWCGAEFLQRAATKKGNSRKDHFLGPALIQAEVSLSNSRAGASTGDEL